MTAKRTETGDQSFPPWAATLASLFARANDWELALQIWKLSSLICTSIARIGLGRSSENDISPSGEYRPRKFNFRVQ